jgi:methionyl-tRNA synthetase
MNDISSIPSMLLFLILIAALWSLFWKGAALWRAARNGDGAWFVVMLLINTLGILELIYLFGVSKVKLDKLFKK